MKVRISSLGQPPPLDSSERLASFSRLSLSLSVLVESALPVPNPKVLALDGQYDQILPESWVVIERPDAADPSKKPTRTPLQVKQTATISKTDYGLSAKVTQLTLSESWLELNDTMLNKLRAITVYAQSEKLDQAEEVISEQIPGFEKDDIAKTEIELGNLYDGLKPGRWLIVLEFRLNRLQPE